jgi:hypothetical protein
MCANNSQVNTAALCRLTQGYKCLPTVVKKHPTLVDRVAIHNGI